MRPDMCPVSCVLWHPSGSSVLSLSPAYPSFRLYDCATDTAHVPGSMLAYAERNAALRVSPPPTPCCAAFSAPASAPSMLALGYRGKDAHSTSQVEILDSASMQSAVPAFNVSSPVTGVQFSRNGHYLLVSTQDEPCIYDIRRLPTSVVGGRQDPRPVVVCTRPPQGMAPPTAVSNSRVQLQGSACRFSSDDSCVMGATKGRAIAFWSSQTGQMLGEPQQTRHNGNLTSLSACPTDDYICTTSADSYANFMSL
ncbi:hypothetical protein KIPB_000473 [Kipferlia bialata]|uniref:Uncharacterized protein n=1 Tax=Kipferlia bialata TaxID=797122 RepID=A0A9K3CQJ6_9EUKA|nr:hypothetical protein KIPB_000473 [Kipferlia bialata]|eukprot:g473.t1